MQQKKSFKLVCLLTLVVLAGTGIVNAALFQPLPYEDVVRGRNSYAYNAAIGHPTYNEQVNFINSIKNTAISAGSTYGLPVSAIIGMACVEGGYGFTRSAYYANNIFGIKIWSQNPEGGWQLKGQPDEDRGRVPVTETLGRDRSLFEEEVRYDNWYRRFASRKEAINYLCDLIIRRYQPARANYQKHLAAGWSLPNASKEFCREIADLGYNHAGGDFYEGRIGATMDRWNLYQYDREIVKETPRAPRTRHRRSDRIKISVDNGRISIKIDQRVTGKE